MNKKMPPDDEYMEFDEFPGDLDFQHADQIPQDDFLLEDEELLIDEEDLNVSD